MTKKGDEELTQTEFGARLEMSRQRVSRFVRDGVLPTTADGKIPWLAGLRALIGHLSEVAAGRGGGSAQVDLSKERALLARAQREAVELKNAISRGEYVLVSEIAREWDSGASILRSHVMSIPTRAAAVIPNLTRHDCSTLDDVVREILHQAADFLDRDLGARPDNHFDAEN